MFYRKPVNKNSISKRKLILGVGINDATYMTEVLVNGKRYQCRAHQVWRGILERCYNPKFYIKHPTYSDCYMCDEWHLFSGFLKWFDSQETDGLQVDKDLKFKGNKEYSPLKCLMVSSKVNKLTIDSGASRGVNPIGVSFKPNRKSGYIAEVSVGGRTKHLGSFKTPEDAHHAYKIGKNEQIRIAMKDNPDIAKYLEQHLYPLD